MPAVLPDPMAFARASLDTPILDDSPLIDEATQRPMRPWMTQLPLMDSSSDELLAELAEQGPAWLCTACGSDSAVWQLNRWMCRLCGNDEFERTTGPDRSQRARNQDDAQYAEHGFENDSKPKTRDLLHPGHQRPSGQVWRSGQSHHQPFTIQTNMPFYDSDLNDLTFNAARFMASGSQHGSLHAGHHQPPLPFGPRGQVRRSGQPEPSWTPSMTNQRERQPQPQRQHQRHGPPADDPSEISFGEFVESEVPTEDPVVDVTPIASDRGPPRRNRRRGRRGQIQIPGPPLAPVEEHPNRDAEVDQPRPNTGSSHPSSGARNSGPMPDPSSSTSSWNSLRGPRPGVKFRGGMAPQPPTWQYEKGDLRAFRKWEKRVEMWLLQVVNYVPKKETGILLYNSLRGELEEELEDAPLEKIYSNDGVTFIMSKREQSTSRGSSSSSTSTSAVDRKSR